MNVLDWKSALHIPPPEGRLETTVADARLPRASRVRNAFYALILLSVLVPFLTATADLRHLSPFWIASGVMLAAYLRCGPRMLPAIFVASVAGLRLYEMGWLVCSVQAAIHTICIFLVSAGLQSVFRFRVQLDRTRDVLALFFVGVAAVPVVEALAVVGMESLSDRTGVWILWWTSEVIGVTVFTPLLLTWSLPSGPQTSRAAAGQFALGALIVIVSVLVHELRTPLSYPYLLFPPVIWITWHYGRRGATMGVFLASIVGVFFGLTDASFPQYIELEMSQTQLALHLVVLSLSMLLLSLSLDDLHAAKENAGRSEQEFRLFMKYGGFVAFIKDSFSRHLFANEACGKLLGLKPEQVIGKTNDELFPPGVAETLNRQDREVLLNNMPGNQEEMVPVAGQKRYWDVHRFPMPVPGSSETYLGEIAVEITARKESDDQLAASMNLLSSISQAQTALISESNPHAVFETMLNEVLALTGSEFGFIGEVLTEHGRPYLKTYAITNIAWNDETRKRYAEDAAKGLEFRNLNSLLGAVLRSGTYLISNDPANDPRRGELPEGHPLLHAFMGIPFHSGNKMVGMLGIANRPGGYDDEIWNFLRPFLHTCSGMIEAMRRERERRAAVEELQISRRRFEDLVSTVDGIVWEADVATSRSTFVSPWVEKMLGYTLEEWYAPNFWSDHIHPEDRDRVISFCEEQTAAFRQHDFEYRFLAKNGRTVWLRDIVTVLHQQGKPTLLRGLTVDVTLQREAQERVAESERRFRDLLQTLHLGVVILDQDERITFMNDYLLALTGWDRDEVLNGKWLEMFVPPEEQATLSAMLHEAFAEGAIPVFWQNPIVTRSGEQRLMRWNNTLLKGAGGTVTACVSVAEDITEQKRAEEEKRLFEARMMQAQKLESLGVMAGGVAHDFNNLLTGIIAGADEIRYELGADSPFKEQINDILHAARHAEELSRQMLAYAGKTFSTASRIDLNDIVFGMQQMLRALISPAVSIRMQPQMILPAIEGDPVQIRQVLMNVAGNAGEAMPGSGTITIRTGSLFCSTAYLSSTYLHSKDLKEGSYVYLEVEDEGTGMDAETVSRLFDPFFTTKFTGRGLGMATVLGIVRMHKGAIQVNSQLGKGTVVRVLIPAAEETAKPVEDSAGDIAIFGKAGKTV